MQTTVTHLPVTPRALGFYVRFWGTRGSIPTPGFQTRKFGGNTSCVEVRVGPALFICDGGTGLRELGVDLLRRGGPAISAHMFFSHPHWDHIQGFPFFTPAYLRENTFQIYGTHLGDRRIFELLSGQMQSDYFPVQFKDLGASILPNDLETVGHVIDGVQVRAFEQHHPGRSFAFSFEAGGLRVVYATDNEVDLTFENAEEVSEDRNLVRRPSTGYLDFIRGADLLIADGQYLDHEYPQRVGWGHARATTLVDAAVLAGVKQLAVYHHDPMHTDDEVDAKIATCRLRAKRLGAEELVIFGAREGMELRLD